MRTRPSAVGVAAFRAALRQSSSAENSRACTRRRSPLRTERGAAEDADVLRRGSAAASQTGVLDSVLAPRWRGWEPRDDTERATAAECGLLCRNSSEYGWSSPLSRNRCSTSDSSSPAKLSVSCFMTAELGMFHVRLWRCLVPPGVCVAQGGQVRGWHGLLDDAASFGAIPWLSGRPQEAACVCCGGAAGDTAVRRVQMRRKRSAANAPAAATKGLPLGHVDGVVAAAWTSVAVVCVRSIVANSHTRAASLGGVSMPLRRFCSSPVRRDGQARGPPRSSVMFIEADWTCVARGR